MDYAHLAVQVALEFRDLQQPHTDSEEAYELSRLRHRAAGQAECARSLQARRRAAARGGNHPKKRARLNYDEWWDLWHLSLTAFAVKYKFGLSTVSRLRKRYSRQEFRLLRRKHD